ncbi:MAG: aminoacyl-tRNA hydrolase [Dehalococcoidia bacterium]|nr:aminoacyl-tRNA hydrolase [Dehalococcoidia bacterium]
MPDYLIVGLGNPGSAYAGTRHNLGYRVIGRLAKLEGIELKHSGVASVGLGSVEDREVALARPRTFMNKSGDALAALVERFRIPLSNVVLVYDDLDLPTGTVRLRLKGGSGGNRGMKSIIQRLGSDELPRIRIGIGRPYRNDEPVYDPSEIADWVLAPPSPADQELLEQATETAIEALRTILREGFEVAMNRHNR